MKVDHRSLLLQVLGDHVDQCCDEDHQGPMLSRCSDVLSTLAHEQGQEFSASRFDAEQERAVQQSKAPEGSWSTTALLGAVRDALFSPPWHRSLRTTVIENGLHHLAERGLPADPIVRDGLGDSLERRMIMRAAGTWWDTRCGTGAPTPSQAEVWMRVLDDGAGGFGPAPTSREAVTAALGGETGRLARELVRYGALADVIRWRPGGTMSPAAPTESDGGSSWITDRFLHTRLGLWRTTSLVWELAWLEDPDRTARAAQVSLAVLQERPTTVVRVTAALGRRALERQLEEVEPTAVPTRFELVEDLVEAINGGHHAQAASLARDAQAAHPEDLHLKHVSASCSIPTDPARAHQALAAVLAGSSRQPMVLAGLICSKLARGDLHEALETLGLMDQHSQDVGGWLWDPHDLVEGAERPGLLRTTLGRWVTEARRAASETTPRAAKK